MNKELHFAVYEHQLVLENKQVISRKFIVLRDGDSLRFTNFHEYALPKRSVKSITSNGNSRLYFIVPLLNFLFFEKGIHTLDEMTVDMVSEYLNLYGLKKLPWDKGTEGRAKATVENSVRVILDFLERFIDDRKGKCLLKKADLYRDTIVRDKHGKTIKVKRPVFDVLYSGDGKRIFRDIPNAAFDIIVNIIFTYHKSHFGSKSAYEREITERAKELIAAVNNVRKERGCMETVGELVLRLKDATNGYQRFLIEKKMKEEANGKTETDQ